MEHTSKAVLKPAIKRTIMALTAITFAAATLTACGPSESAPKATTAAPTADAPVASGKDYPGSFSVANGDSSFYVGEAPTATAPCPSCAPSMEAW